MEKKFTGIDQSSERASECHSPHRIYNSRVKNEDPENEDLRPPTNRKRSHYENEDPPRKRWPITKTKTHHENKDILLKQVQKRLVLSLWTKIMFMRHTTKTKILTVILNSEFGTSVIYIIRNISTVEPHGAFNGTALKLKRDLVGETWHACGGIYRGSSFSQWVFVFVGSLRFRNGSSFS